jgi:hypothetical protein
MDLLRSLLARDGVEITDTRAQLVGADAVGTDGRYFEIKAHADAADGPLNMQGSEVLKARELGDKYVLVVVEHLESDGASPPRITLIPSPLSVLAVHPYGKIELTGYHDDAFEYWEFPVK